jgi:phenylacetate-coenzyme A ligase PaaK-like adenylate-forming protein
VGLLGILFDAILKAGEIVNAGGATDGPNEFRKRLLPLTLGHGVQIDFYRKHWGTETAPSELTDIPTVSKRADGGDLETLRHPDLQPAMLMHSTGTTGRPFRRFRSREELDAYREYAEARMAKANDGAPGRPILAFNSIPGSVHGSTMDAPGISYRMSIDFFSDFGIRNALTLLSDTALFRREGHVPTRMIIGAPNMLVALTALCDVQSIDPADFEIDQLYCISDVLTKKARSYLCSRWGGTQLRDIFSCSESVGAAVQCGDCGGYHYEPLVWPEILDLDTDDTVDEGIGELTLTELYPFSQIQPLLRYRTGDIVKRLRCPARPYELAFQPLGRLTACPTVRIDGRSRVLIGGTELREILEDEPDVARETVLGVQHPLVGQIPLGPPRAAWAVRDDGSFELTVEASFSLGLFPQHAEDLRERLAASLGQKLDRVAVALTEPGTGLAGLTVRPMSPEPDAASLGR